MSKSIIVCGHGPGISDAVARKFGKEGFSVALVARNAERLSRAAAELERAGIEARAFPCDLSNPDAVRSLVREVKTALGPVAVIHWNAYMGVAGDLTTASSSDFRSVLDVAAVSMVAALQEALPDLKAQKGALLITGGGFAFYDPNVDKAIVQWNAMAVSVGKAAQHKLAGILNKKLAPEGVYVGEVVVLGTVKGTAFDQGGPDALNPTDIAEKFWLIQQQRSSASVNFPG